LNKLELPPAMISKRTNHYNGSHGGISGDYNNEHTVGIHRCNNTNKHNEDHMEAIVQEAGNKLAGVAHQNELQECNGGVSGTNTITSTRVGGCYHGGWCATR
jgi:hypothetical protein